MPQRILTILLVGCLALGLAVSDLQAVIISTLNGDGNTSAPTGYAYWDNIGTSTGGTALYLGNRWVLTVNHIGARDVTLAGTVYSPLAGATIRLVNNDVNKTPIDLILYRVASDPLLPAMPLPTHAPANSDTVTLIGNGYNRQQLKTYWDSTWTVTDPPGTYAGWLWDTSGRTTRWGTNVVTAIGLTTDTGNGPTRTFSMNFDQSSGNEGMVAPGDSGGPVFYRSGTNFTLMGMLDAMSLFAGQPGAAAIDNLGPGHNVSYAADLYYYRVQLSPMEGDANNDGAIDQTDYAAWFNNYGTGNTWAQADFNSNGLTDATDYAYWFNNYGGGNALAGGDVAEALPGQGVPEPASVAIFLAGLLAMGSRWGRKKTTRNPRQAA